jgi:hypothetical protein
MAIKIPNKQYNVAQPDSIAVRLAVKQRRRMYQLFLTQTKVMPDETILDIGVTSDQTYASSNYLEAWYPYKRCITAAGLDDAKFLEDLYPGVKFVSANGLNLPFEDESFDVVHSSAVLEHVGSDNNQRRFIRECCRVARRAVFITTPNRWFPVEFHTVLPLVHWLPKPIFRTLMRRMGLDFFAEESNLNLMSSREVRAAGQVDGFDTAVSTVSLGGWPSNLLLLMSRRGSGK